LLLYHLTGRTAASAPLSASGPAAAPAASLRITGRFFWLTNAIAVSTFALTLLIFFLLPASASASFKSREEKACGRRDFRNESISA
jgi:hypothetical protein